MKLPLPVSGKPPKSLSFALSARGEEGCIAAVVEPLPVELRLKFIPHAILAVDDGSMDSTWAIPQELKAGNPDCEPVQKNGEHGFGRAISLGCNRVAGGAALATTAADGLARKAGGGIYSGAWWA